MQDAGCLRNAGAASRGDSRGGAGGESRMLCDFGDSGAEATGGGGLVDLESRHCCRCEERRERRGKAPTAKTHFMYAADNLSAYGVFAHRHTGELLEQLGLTADADCVHAAPAADSARDSVDDLCAVQRSADPRAIERVYREFYAGSPMVRIYAQSTCRRFSIRCARITAISDFNLRRMGGAR